MATVGLGTAIFSGVVFISTGDAAVLLVRYLASGTMCRFIIYFEVGGMRKVREKSDTVKCIVQAKPLEVVNATQIASTQESGGEK